jgi:formate/nitrite transporter FocA (FNT family)
MTTEKKQKPTKITEHSLEQPKEPYEIMVEQVEAGLKEHHRSNIGLFLSSLSAGLEVVFSILTIGIIYTLFKTEVSASKLHLMMAMVYPIGYVFVIIGRSELFTEHTVLATLPVLNGRATFKSLFNLWAIIYSGNLIGGYLFGTIVLQFNSGTHLISLDFFHFVSQKMIAYSSINILVSGIMAGWLMGTLSWLLSSVQDTLSRIAMIFFITFIISIAGLHHCIVGSIEIFMAYFGSANNISGLEFIKFQSLATLGNIIGGVVLVALVKYGHSKRK